MDAESIDYLGKRLTGVAAGLFDLADDMRDEEAGGEEVEAGQRLDALLNELDEMSEMSRSLLGLEGAAGSG